MILDIHSPNVKKPGQVGFTNYSNSCYCNASLQIFLHTPNFSQIQNSKGYLTAWLCAIANSYWSEKYNLINNIEIMNTLSTILRPIQRSNSASWLHFQEQLLIALAEDVNQVNYPEEIFSIYLIDVTAAATDYEAKKRRNMSSSVNDMFRAVQVTILDCPCSLNQKIFEDKISFNICNIR